MKKYLLCRAAALTAAILTSVSLGGDPLRTNTNNFRIPFAIEAAPGQEVEGSAILFSSFNGGPLQQVQRVSSKAGGFGYTASSDGRYGFAVRMTDARGELEDGERPLSPELEVIVDTVAPRLNLDATETSPGTVRLTWNCDSAVTPGSIRIEYAEGSSGRWLPVKELRESTGTTQIKVSPGTALSVRGYVTDLAGNEGGGTARLVLAKTIETPAEDLLDPRREIAANLRDAGNREKTAAATQSGRRSVVDIAGANGLSFPDRQPASPVTPPGQQAPWRQPPTQPLNSFTTNNSTRTSSQSPIGRSIGQPVGRSFGGPVRQPPLTQQAAANGAQLIRNRMFDLSYEVEGVGPSGVSAVELFVTEDGGQQWFRYGRDGDLRSPFQVDTRSEGTFGFAVRVTNGLGFGDPPPQPGERPSIVVTVDQTPPDIRLGVPQVLIDGGGQVQINWQVADSNPARDGSVRLEYATNANGPWTPAFDWQADRGGYQMPIDRGFNSGLYFRLSARDAAGNTASRQTLQPVIIDQNRPKARLLQVHPAAFQQSF